MPNEQTGGQPAAAAAGAAQYTNPQATEVPQPYPHGAEGPSTPVPSAAPAEPPPGMDDLQLPQAHLRQQGVKRAADDAPASAAAPAQPPARRPVEPPPAKTVPVINIGTPQRNGEDDDGKDSEHSENGSDGETSLLEKETEDETAKQPEAKVEKDAFYKITEVMAGINKSIELLMKRVD